MADKMVVVAAEHRGRGRQIPGMGAGDKTMGCQFSRKAAATIYLRYTNQLGAYNNLAMCSDTQALTRSTVLFPWDHCQKTRSWDG